MVGLFAGTTQFPLAVHTVEVLPLHEEIVPAEAVPAATIPTRAKKAAQKAVVAG